MQESQVINYAQSKEEQYQFLLKNIEELVTSKKPSFEKLSPIISSLFNYIDFDKLGFYFVRNGELIPGPLLGSESDRKIPIEKSICWVAYMEERLVWVDDVEQFPGYIPPSEQGQSAMVIPGFKNGDLSVLLKLNKNQPKKFDQTDKRYLLKIMHNLVRLL